MRRATPSINNTTEQVSLHNRSGRGLLLAHSSRRRSGTALLCRLSRHPGLQTELPGCGKLVFAPEAQSRAKYSAPNFVWPTPGSGLSVMEESELRLRKEGDREGGNFHRVLTPSRTHCCRWNYFHEESGLCVCV